MKRFVLAFLLAGCGGAAATAPAATAPPASEAPAARKAVDFTLTDSDGNSVALHDLLRHGPVILAFFPKAFTAG